MQGVRGRPVNIGQYAKLVSEKNEAWCLCMDVEGGVKVASGGKPGVRRRLCTRYTMRGFMSVFVHSVPSKWPHKGFR